MSIEKVYDVFCSIGISISLEKRVIHLLSDISPVFSEVLLESEYEKNIHHDQFGKTKNEEKEYNNDFIGGKIPQKQEVRGGKNFSKEVC